MCIVVVVVWLKYKFCNWFSQKLGHPNFVMLYRHSTLSLMMYLHLSSPCQRHIELQCLEMMLCLLFICVRDGKQCVVQRLSCMYLHAYSETCVLRIPWETTKGVLISKSNYMLTDTLRLLPTVHIKQVLYSSFLISRFHCTISYTHKIYLFL